MTCNLRTVNSSLRTVKNFTDRTNCTDPKDIAPLSNFTSKAEIVYVSLMTCNLLTVKLFLTNRKLNSRTVTVPVYWTTLNAKLVIWWSCDLNPSSTGVSNVYNGRHWEYHVCRHLVTYSISFASNVDSLLPPAPHPTPPLPPFQCCVGTVVCFV